MERELIINYIEQIKSEIRINFGKKIDSEFIQRLEITLDNLKNVKSFDLENLIQILKVYRNVILPAVVDTELKKLDGIVNLLDNVK